MELHRAQESALNIRDTARRDRLSRGKICSKLVKYPDIQDYAVYLSHSPKTFEELTIFKVGVEGTR